MTDEDRQARRNVAAKAIGKLCAQLEEDIKSGRVDVVSARKLQLECAVQGARLFGAHASGSVTLKSEPIPREFLAAPVDPAPTAELSPDGAASPLEMYAEGFSFAKIGKYMVAREKRNQQR